MLLFKEAGIFLNHVMEKSINFVFTATEITIFNKMVSFLASSTIGSVQFEGPQHVRNIFEIVANSENFVDHVLNTNDSMTTQISFNKFV